MRNIYITLTFVFALFFSSIPNATADSWWGDGAKGKEWVLSHGGTIIRYSIIANGSKDRYKAILYKNGKVVEWENGKSGMFDDPKDATYVVKAFKGGINEQNKTSKGGKKILSSGPIVAHPGETITVTLNDFTNKVTVVSDRKVVAAKKVAPPVVEKKTQPVEQSAPISAPIAEEPKEIALLPAVIAPDVINEEVKAEVVEVVPVFPKNDQDSSLPFFASPKPFGF
ncbi:MAG: hypothetical protein PHP62_02460 [Candidatus Moranbacteria bacterium]|nr:hypothetical protein [Candidatus Moranbacteria bacterium]